MVDGGKGGFNMICFTAVHGDGGNIFGGGCIKFVFFIRNGNITDPA